MLAASVHLYFKTCERQLRRPVDKSMASTFTKQGCFRGYMLYFERSFGVKFENSGCNLALLEELMLARNRVQHPDSITTQHSHYSKDDLRKLPSPLFVDDRERELLQGSEGLDASWLLPPAIHVTAERLSSVILEIRKFTEWLEATDH